MAVSIILLVVGIALLLKGADFFVDGASGIARKARIPAVVIGLTIVSVGTSLPELSVSVTSAVKHLNDMSFGNVVGSNIFNVLVVVGVAAMVTPMTVHRSVLRYDIPILLGIYALFAVFAYLISPGMLSRGESIALLILFVAYTVFLLFRAKKDPDPIEEESADRNYPWWADLLFLAVGGVGIVFGGNATVEAASKIALRLGMSELLVALTVVAIGTSLPELITSVVAAKKGKMDIAIGNAVGSCIANLLLIFGLSSTITPLSIAGTGLDMIIMALSAILVWLFCLRTKQINRAKGIVFVAIYALYFVYIILRNIYPSLALNF